MSVSTWRRGASGSCGFTARLKSAWKLSAENSVSLKAEQALERLSCGLNRRALKRREQIERAVNKATQGADGYLSVVIQEQRTTEQVQVGRGRPGPDTGYAEQEKIHYHLEWQRDESEIRRAQRSDGVFPLVDNTDLEPIEVLRTYKNQPYLEKRFHSLAARIKEAFPRLPILLLLDGLYPTGPVMARCRTYHWQFMIVLQDGSLPSVWEEFHSLLPLQQDNEKQQNWGDREQAFRWVNHIRYEYAANGKNHITVHLVLCQEQWQAVDENAQILTKTSKHAWLSSRPLNRHNVHERCNLAGRYRCPDGPSMVAFPSTNRGGSGWIS